jgi:hypothetical protein
MSRLEYPVAPEDLYFARGGEVDDVRPILPGDTFRDVTVPGVADVEDSERLAVVVTHPCSMRRGADLAEHLLLARVRKYPPIPLEKWAEGHFRVMPLPVLVPDRVAETYAADFDLLGRVPSADLGLDRRIAIMSHKGISLLQQRFVHNLTRVVVPQRTLLQQMEPVLEEAELLEEWLRRLATDDPHVQAREREAREFDNFLCRKESLSEGTTLREDLRMPELRTSVRRSVRHEVSRRESSK